MLKRYLSSSIGRKQIVAVTGLLLIGYLIFHLTMNLLIFGGAALYNFFPNQAHQTGYFLRLLEFGLGTIFVTHIWFTVKLVIHNIKSRGASYSVYKPKKRSIATRLMPYTGGILVLFLLLHLKDYVLIDPTGPLSVVNGESLMLYGVVVNSFSNFFRVFFYVIAFSCVGFHLAHGIQSVFQSFGLYHEVYTPWVKRLSVALGVGMALLLSVIPVSFYFVL